MTEALLPLVLWMRQSRFLMSIGMLTLSLCEISESRFYTFYITECLQSLKLNQWLQEIRQLIQAHILSFELSMIIWVSMVFIDCSTLFLLYL